MLTTRKLRKLARDPRKFLADSSYARWLPPSAQHWLKAGEFRDKSTLTDTALTLAMQVETFFHHDPGSACRAHRGQRPYLYLPWIAGHGDALLHGLSSDAVPIVPLPLFRDVKDPAQRVRVKDWVRVHPDRFRKILLSVLAPLRDDMAGMLFTLDWAPPMRLAVHACKELGIPTILIPHEGVFADRERYYRDLSSGVGYPITDLSLPWGALQREIFTERGYPSTRCVTVGSPKLDDARNFQPRLSRALFAQIMGFDPERPIVLYALQPLDSQFDARVARQAQGEAVCDILTVCEARGMQLLIRFPPDGRNPLSEECMERLHASPCATLDDGHPYLVSAAEAIWHASVVCSINSTMLIEALLMGRGAFSTKYVEFEQLWAHADLPVARNIGEIHARMEEALAKPGLTDRGKAWVEEALAGGSLDGESRARIHAVLEEVRAVGIHRHGDDPMVSRLFSDHIEHIPFGTAVFHKAPERSMAHVEAMLGFQRVLYAPDLIDAAVGDVFVKWGVSTTFAKEQHDRMATLLGRPQLVIEDGFLRSLDSGLSGEPGLSIIVDTKTAYLDATRPSRLEDRLNSPQLELTPGQKLRAERCMELISSQRLSKYNRAPDTMFRYAAGPCVLVVDQCRGAQSVVSGLADEASFDAMLRYALRERPDHTILIKRHPDTIQGGRGGYFSSESLGLSTSSERIVLIDHDVNPHTLFDQVDEVFVVTSHMGFEALMVGLPVHCFGVPFYSGWGVTTDHLVLPRRKQKREVGEIFHVAYIESSRYYCPLLAQAAEIEDVINHLAVRRARLPTRESPYAVAS